MMIEKNFNIIENKLLYNGKQVVTTKSVIEFFLVVSEYELIIVLVNAAKLKSDRNIFCYGFDEELKWQIPEPDKLHNDNYYTSIYLSDGNLSAYNINGVEVTIDKHNGRILNKQLIK